MRLISEEEFVDLLNEEIKDAKDIFNADHSFHLQNVIENTTTIDPESLPVVKELRKRGLTKKTQGKKCIKKETLCWKCAKACGGCSWSSKAHKPVDGWTAERRDVPVQNKPEPLESYIVESCPEFVSDGKKHERIYYNKIEIPHETMQKIIKLREKGVTYKKISEIFGFSEYFVYSRLAAYRNSRQEAEKNAQQSNFNGALDP